MENCNIIDYFDCNVWNNYNYAILWNILTVILQNIYVHIWLQNILTIILQNIYDYGIFW
jgi:hypothetical protein